MMLNNRCVNCKVISDNISTDIITLAIRRLKQPEKIRTHIFTSSTYTLLRVKYIYLFML